VREPEKEFMVNTKGLVETYRDGRREKRCRRRIGDG